MGKIYERICQIGNGILAVITGIFCLGLSLTVLLLAPLNLITIAIASVPFVIGVTILTYGYYSILGKI